MPMLTTVYPTHILKEPLINYVMSLAHRLIRNQGAILRACVGLVKSCKAYRILLSPLTYIHVGDAECSSACKPRRARPEAQRYNIINQRLLNIKLGVLRR